MNKLHSYLLLILVFSSLLGCGSSSDNEETAEIVEPVEDRILESNVLGDSELDELVLNGSWVSECLANDSDSSIYQWSFDGNSMEFTKREFTGLECQDSFSHTKLKGHFELGEVLTLDNGQQVNKIRYMLDATEVIYYSVDVVSQFNNIELCDLAEWRVGQYKDVTGCEAFKSASEIGNDVFLINGGILSTGDINTVGLNSFPNQLLDYTYAFREPEVIEGDWMQACFSSSENSASMKSMSFNSGAFSRKTDYFDESSCDVAFYSAIESGVASIGEELILSSGLTVTALDLNISSLKLAFYSEFYLNYFNSVAACGITDWLIGEFREVYECEFFSGEGDIEGGIKDIFYIEEDRLFLGKGAYLGGSSYPIELDEAFFTR